MGNDQTATSQVGLPKAVQRGGSRPSPVHEAFRGGVGGSRGRWRRSVIISRFGRAQYDRLLEQTIRKLEENSKRLNAISPEQLPMVVQHHLAVISWPQCVAGPPRGSPLRGRRIQARRRHHARRKSARAAWLEGRPNSRVRRCADHRRILPPAIHET